jgi:hypothetical protein
MWIYIDSDEFGDPGPFEAESFEALVDEVADVLEEMVDNQVDVPGSREERIAEMREEFVSVLVDCTAAQTVRAMVHDYNGGDWDGDRTPSDLASEFFCGNCELDSEGLYNYDTDTWIIEYWFEENDRAERFVEWLRARV